MLMFRMKLKCWLFQARYAVENNLGGIMFWSIDMDDFKGNCHPRAFPLIKAGRETFLAKPKSNSTGARPIMTMPPPSHPVQTIATEATTEKLRTTLSTRQPTRRRTSPTPTRFVPKATTPTMNIVIDQGVDNNLPDESNEVSDSKIPDSGRSFHSNRDIVFQNVKVWITNHYYS